MKKYRWLKGLLPIIMISMIVNFSPKVYGLSFINPIQCMAPVTGLFGEMRGHYMHEGIDVVMQYGEPIYAAADGVITKAAPDSKGVEAGGGHMIFIDHGYGIESRYMHLSLYMVEQGEEVRAGQIVGYTGDSGDSTRPLLHYELRVDNQPIDPSFLFKIEPIEGLADNQKDEVVEEKVKEDFLRIPQN